jgi:putative endonuclease
MAKHLDTGKRGEEIAAEYLRQVGFELLETNWRYGRFEVDIIAKDERALVFVEVKTRSYDYFGKPETFVDKRKESNLAAAAAVYMEQTGHEWEVRFDVVSVLFRNEKQYVVELIKDAFFPGIA